MPNSKQQIANTAFRKKLKRIDVQIPLETWPMVEQYANARGLTPGALLKDCLSRCMQLDGYTAIVTSVSQAKQAKSTQDHDVSSNVAASVNPIGE